MILWLQAVVDPAQAIGPVPDDLVTKPILGKSWTKRIKKRLYTRRMVGSWSNPMMVTRGGGLCRNNLVPRQFCRPQQILCISVQFLLAVFFCWKKIGLHIAKCTLCRGPLVPVSWRMLRTWMLQNSKILSIILGAKRELVSCTRTIFISILFRRWGQPTWLFHSVPPASVNNASLWKTSTVNLFTFNGRFLAP